ncbi:MAG: hypothetical protein R3B51_02840 [Thermodesulfobacteriota bacterium]
MDDLATAAAMKTNNIKLDGVGPAQDAPGCFCAEARVHGPHSQGRVTLTLGVGESMNLDAYGISGTSPFEAQGIDAGYAEALGGGRADRFRGRIL